MLRRIKSYFAVKTKSFIIREDQARHLVTPKQMNICWAIGIGSKIGDHPLPMEIESSLHTRRGQSLHFTIRIEGKSKIGRSLKDQFLSAHQPLILESP